MGHSCSQRIRRLRGRRVKRYLACRSGKIAAAIRTGEATSWGTTGQFLDCSFHFSEHRFIPDSSPNNRDIRRSFLAGDRNTRFCIWKLMLLPENASTWLDDVEPKAIKESTFSFARARRGLRRFVIKQIFLKFCTEPGL